MAFALRLFPSHSHKPCVHPFYTPGPCTSARWLRLKDAQWPSCGKHERGVSDRKYRIMMFLVSFIQGGLSGSHLSPALSDPQYSRPRNGLWCLLLYCSLLRVYWYDFVWSRGTSYYPIYFSSFPVAQLWACLLQTSSFGSKALGSTSWTLELPR